MSTTKKRKKGKYAGQRIVKVIGLLLLLFSLYFFVAYVSYFFTWRADQDAVLRLSWSILFDNEVQVSNWLGRLGAVISHFFIYWGFGVASILWIPIFFNLGRVLIKRIKFIKLYYFAQPILVVMAFLSVMLAFVFQHHNFPWGGSFGTSVAYWLTNFLGNIGLTLLLLVSVAIWFVWKYNLALESISLALPDGRNIKLPSMLKFKMRKKKSAAQKSVAEDEKETAPTKPTSAQQETGVKASSGKPQPTYVPLDDDEDEDIIPPATPKANPIPTKNPLTTQSTSQDAALSEKQESANDAEGTMEFEVPKPKTQSAKSTKTKTDAENLEMDIAVGDGNSSEVEQQFDMITQEDSEPNKETTTAANYAQTELNITQEENEDDALFDPTLELRNYKFPTLDLLHDYSDQRIEVDREELQANKDQIVKTLLNYKIEIIKIRATVGPTVTLYEIVPAPGIKISKIKNLEDDIALSLAALGIRIIAPIPGKGTIGIEVPNKKKQIVSFKEVISTDKFRNSKMDLPLALGKTISNEVFIADLAKMPHLLIAGATGQGKSVGINTIISSLLYKKHPSQVKLVLIDPKKVELFPYSLITKHFLAYLPNEEEPIVTETSKVIYTINSLCIEMDTRYDLLKKARVRNIREYNEKFVARKLNPLNGHKYMPFIVLVIDEFADLIMTAGKEVELPIARIAQLARAVGIHLIIATQRPSVNIITGVIKANFPARLAFKVTSKIDSRTILDTGGADQLIGRGDMLLSVGGNLVRLQCAFADTPEVERIVEFIGSQQGFAEPYYLPEYNGEDAMGGGDNNLSLKDLDDMFWDAAHLVVMNQHGSTSMLQRKLQLGYNRAGRIMDQLQAMGIVGESQGSKPREVFYFTEAELVELKERLLNA